MHLFDQEKFKISGMSCPTCASNVEHILKKIDGVEEVRVDLSDATAHIWYNHHMVTAVEMNELLSEVGYGLMEVSGVAATGEETKHELQLNRLREKFIWCAALSLPVLLISLLPHGIFRFANELMVILSTPVLFFFGRDIFVGAYNRAIRGTVTMDTLIAIGTGSAWLLSTSNAFFPFVLFGQAYPPPVYFQVTAVVTAMMMLSKYLEAFARSHINEEVLRLRGFQAKTAVVKVGGIEKTVPANQVKIGDLIVINNVAIVPADGKVVEGSGKIDESMLTAESELVEKEVGDQVIGATVNREGKFVMSVEKVGEATVLAHIIRSVKEAQVTRTPIQRQVDHISSIFVPAVILISILTALGWYFLGPEPPMTVAFITAITVLIIACPCALGLATPTANIVGIGKAAEYGILIKEAAHLETIQKISAVVFDQIGIITLGKPIVTNVILSNVHRNDDEDLLSVILGIENKTNHPFAIAISEYLTEHDIKQTDIENISPVTGKGVRAHYRQNQFFIGSPAWFSEENIAIPDDLFLKINELSKQNKSLVLAGYNDKATVLIALRDNITPSAYRTIKQLKQFGVDIHMLTDEQEQTALMIAHELEIDNFRGNMKAIDKQEYIQSLQAADQLVAMIGNDTTDSLAMKQADISISVTNGTDFASNDTDITLIKGDLWKIITAIRISKKTSRIIRQNLTWAYLYNVVAILVATGLLFPLTGYLISPLAAGIAMAFTSVSVIFNSLRLKNIKIQ